MLYQAKIAIFTFLLQFLLRMPVFALFPFNFGLANY